MTSRASTEVAIEKRKNTFKERKHQQGSNNSQFGKRWVNNGVEVLKVNETEIDYYLLAGYVRGRKIKEDLLIFPQMVLPTIAIG